MQPADICVLDPVTHRVLVPAAALGEALEHVDRLETEVKALRCRLADAERALREEMARPPWWEWWRRRTKMGTPDRVPPEAG